LNNIGNLPLYSDAMTEKQVKNQSGMQAKEKTEADFLFDSEVECPVCHHGIAVRRLKRSALRLKSRDTDFMPVYEHINPLYYDIWVCNHCGYAASESSFHQPLTKAEIEAVLQNISVKWRARNYPRFYDADVAVERYKLALLCAAIRKARTIDIAMLCLKLGWVYRSKQDTEKETNCLLQALSGLKLIFEKGPFPVAGMDESSLAFLIGELSRRVGQYDEALKYLRQVILDRNAKNSLRERARDQRQLILKTLQSTADAEPQSADEPESPRVNPSKKGLKGLFLRNP